VEKETTATAISTFSGCSREMMERIPCCCGWRAWPRRGGFYVSLNMFSVFFLFFLFYFLFFGSFRLCGDLGIVGNGAFDSIITHLNHFFTLKSLHFFSLFILFWAPPGPSALLVFLVLYIANATLK
jgi:hypothetical protein